MLRGQTQSTKGMREYFGIPYMFIGASPFSCLVDRAHRKSASSSTKIVLDAPLMQPDVDRILSNSATWSTRRHPIFSPARFLAIGRLNLSRTKQRQEEHPKSFPALVSSRLLLHRLWVSNWYSTPLLCNLCQINVVFEDQLRVLMPNLARFTLNWIDLVLRREYYVAYLDATSFGQEPSATGTSVPACKPSTARYQYFMQRRDESGYSIERQKSESSA